MACGGGDQSRVRNVEIPIRGDGKCPKAKSSSRRQNQDCNTNECVGDEICIARQDLVISVDGSGSIKADGFKLVTNFTGELLKRYTTEYYGETTMQLALILFGNGVIEDDGSISKATLLRELTTDMAATKQAAAAMEHQKGFTNMAQAFSLAEKLLQQRGRKDAQSAVLTISDGKPSFLFETREQANNLESKGIMRYMVGIAEFPASDAWQLMKELASQPSETNTVRVPGIDALQDGAGAFVEQALVKFCPASQSPSSSFKEWKRQGWMLVRRRGVCGGSGRLLSRSVRTRWECFYLATAVGATSFLYGRKFNEGKCKVGIGQFDCSKYKQWAESPDEGTCPDASPFESNRGYHWFAIQPADCIV
jgi:hypothetical protein